MKKIDFNLKLGITTIIFTLIHFLGHSQIITTVAGNGFDSIGYGRFSGDGGIADSASLYDPMDVTVDSSGNFFISDQGNQRIREVNKNGIITTVAGNGIKDIYGNGSYSGDGGLATLAGINDPQGITIDAFGNLYIADMGNEVVRMVNKNGIISTIAGNSRQGYSGDGGLATLASFNNPTSVAVDKIGNIYITDFGNNVVRKVDKTGIISTIAGNGKAGYSGDGDSAVFACLNGPDYVALDAFNNLFIVEENNNCVRKVTKTGIITTVAGNGLKGFSGDGSIATMANLSLPWGICLDTIGNLYIVDQFNNRIRKVSTNGIINTVAGNGINGYSGDEGDAKEASLNFPDGVAVDLSGNLYIADLSNQRIRRVSNINSLPVTISSFNATVNNKTIQTNWQTTTELNTSHFIIQHSTDGSSFTDIGSVKAIGIGANGYGFTDTHPASGINYYRLESVDKDGAVSYSKIVSCELSVVSKQLTVYPNPAKEAVTIKGNHIVAVQVIDNMGRVVKVVELKDAANPSLSVSGLRAGVYHLRIQTTDGGVSGAGFVKE